MFFQYTLVRNNDDLDGMQIALPKDRIKYLESQTQSLEMQLAYRSEMTSNAVIECDNMRDQLAEATQKYKEEKQMTMDVTRTMTRQYKGMQEDLLNKINERERIIQTLKDHLETQKVIHREQIAKKDEVIKQKDTDAEKYREETENMCKEFANLLLDARLKICNHTKVRDIGTVMKHE